MKRVELACSVRSVTLPIWLEPPPSHPTVPPVAVTGPADAPLANWRSPPLTVTTLPGARLEPARTKSPAETFVGPVYVHDPTMNTMPGPVEVTPPVFEATPLRVMMLPLAASSVSVKAPRSTKPAMVSRSTTPGIEQENVCDAV